MKKLVYLITLGLTLLAGLTACQEKPEQPVDAVELRYRANDKYELPATSPQSFTIVVKSTKHWTVRSAHPDWCIIDVEEGEAEPDSLVHQGKGNNTSVHVQYYDNDQLDDRTDQIEIASGGWVGKTVTVYQKGIAYLEVPADETEFMVEKAGGDVVFHVNSNQDWSARVTEGDDWLSVKEGATGRLDGTVTLTAKVNAEEQRYAQAVVYDRHDVAMALIKFTQDGVQLEPLELEIRAAYDQGSYELPVEANTAWTAVKEDPGTDWYSIENPSNSGSGTLRIKLQDNTGDAIRGTNIILKTVASEEGGYQAEKVVWLRQAYPETPSRVLFDTEEIGKWSVTNKAGEWTGTPSFNGTGMLMESPTQIKQTMEPPGYYNFHWTNITGTPCVRLWYVFSGQEIKYKNYYSSGSASVSLSGSAGSVSGLSSASFDPSTGHDMGIKFTPLPGGYCHVMIMLDDKEVTSFDTSATVLSSGTWGTKVDLYLGVEEGGSAVCEWYEYTKPFSWD